MDDEARRRLAGLADDAEPGSAPVEEVERRARRIKRRRRTTSIVVGVAISLVIALPLAALSGLGGSGQGSSNDGASPPPGTYVIQFPDQVTMQPNGINADLQLTTNLPDGTKYEIGGDQYGSCCPAVQDGVITLDQLQNAQGCYATVGDIGHAPPFKITVTVAPHFQVGMVGLGLKEPDPSQGEQPQSLLDELGTNFEQLSGPQVIDNPDQPGKELFASHTYSWPEPQCNGPLPLFNGLSGGETCNPDDQGSQLQGHTLGAAMSEIMGALSQARVCEIWSLALPPDVEQQHPWPAFADEWRSWYLDPPKDFTGGRDVVSWKDSPLDWSVTGKDGTSSVVVVTNGGVPILQLTLEPLPEFCPNCDANVVPFWGVTDWRFLDRSSG